MIRFELPIRTPLMNQWQRMHWAKQRRLAREYGWLIRAHLPRTQWPERPIKRYRIVIARESTREPDPGAIWAGAKALVDALQPPSKRHPYGTGILLDDSTAHCIDYDEQHIPGKGERTIVTIYPEGE